MIIVTGGAGFIGSNIVKTLNQGGADDILIVDRLGITDKWKNLRGLRFSDYEHRDRFIEKLDRGVFDRGTRAVIHMGACSSTTERDADYLMANNYGYSRRLAERFAGNQKVRFIYASSAATYGRPRMKPSGHVGVITEFFTSLQDQLPHPYRDNHDELQDLRPLNMYGYSKHLFDLWALRTGFLQRSVGLKYFNVFGPNEYHKGEMRSVAIRAYFQAKTDGTIKLFKSYHAGIAHGDQARDFIYVKDAVKITLFFLARPELNGIFNAGTGKARTFNDLARAVMAALGKDPVIEYIDMPPGLESRYQYFTQADITKLRAAGFSEPFYSLEDAVQEYVREYLEKDERSKEM